MTALIGVAHGSRDPRSAATVAELMAEVARLRPELDVRTAFLDLSAPRLPDVLAGVGAAVVVPLLLGRAYHARVDIPAAVARARRPDVVAADVLGRAVEEAALERLAQVCALEDPGLGVVLAGIGSSDARANSAVADIAQGWRRRFGWTAATAAFATADPSVADAVAHLRAAGAERVAVAQWILAPGLLPDRIERAAAAAGVPVAAPMGAHEAVARVVTARYDEARTASTARTATA